MRGTGKLAAIVLAALFGTPAGAYYHYVHYLSRNGPFTPLLERFDLNALPNKTVTVFVSDSGPTALAPNDSFSSVLSQIRQAALAWNSVDSSDLRVAFGGLIQGSTAPNTPGVQVLFGELPPGFLAFTVPLPAPSPAQGAAGPFFPLQRSITSFRRDLTVSPGPSYLDSFFTTAVHEFGHALGLQHTFTSSTMTVAVNRNTNRSRPLDADDVAGLSVLYPKAGYQGSVGGISGRVTANGQPVAMASVVALRPAASAISTLTNPDGTYTLSGLPPDTYYVYVHPIPPTADITPPKDASGQPFVSAVPYFETVFFPGTRDVTQFVPLNIGRGNTISGIDFSVRPRTNLAMYDGVTYSYIGQTASKPAFVNSTTPQAALVFNASPATVAPQGVQVLGIGNVQVQTYGNPLNLAVYFPLGAGVGPRHLLLNLGTDMYVLPSALNLVQKGPPQNVSLAPQSDGSVLVSGSNMGADSSVYFDGLPARVRVPFNGSDAAGVMTVVPPPGFSGQRATVTVFNSDGQSSMVLQSQNPPVYSYPFSDGPQVSVNPSSLPAGVSSLVDIAGANTNFVDGQVTVGFGTNDVFVRRVWVLSPNRVVANVTVQPNAAPGASEITVISGFQMFTQPLAFVAQPANPRQPTVTLPLTNLVPNQQNFFPGAQVSAQGVNLTPASGTATVNLTDANGVNYPAAVLGSSSSQVVFAIPPNMPTGVATLRVNSGTDAALPVAIQIDSQPPVIASVTSSSNVALDSSHSASAGEVLSLQVTGLDPGVMSAPSRVRVTASGIELPITAIQGGSQAGALLVQVVVTQSFGGQQVPLTISQDGTLSNPFSVTIK